MEQTNSMIKATAVLGQITTNFEELKISIAKKMKPYQGLVYVDETMKDAKVVRAELNKMIAEIETERKRIKGVWNNPYDAFEVKVKELIAIINKPILEIDTQIKDFEERRKADKDKAIVKAVEDHLSAVDEEFKDIVVLCGVETDNRWQNSTFSMKKIDDDIQSQIDSIIADVKSLQVLCEGDDMLSDLLTVYQSTGDLSKTIQKRSAILSQREAFKKMEAVKAERTRLAEEAKAEADKVAEAVTPEPPKQELIPEEKPAPVEQPRWSPAPVAPKPEKIIHFRIDVKESEGWNMMQFFDKNNIKFEILEVEE